MNLDKVFVECKWLVGNKCTIEDPILFKKLFYGSCKSLNCGKGGYVDWVTYIIFKDNYIDKTHN
jgi:hypothetical protein